MRAIAFLTLLAACATPRVGPDPALSAVTYDCDAPSVETEHAAVAPAIESCVAGPPAEVAPCLDDIAQNFAHPDTIGCVARDRGAQASAAVASGTADARERRIAENVRTWIRSGGRSFR